MDIQKNIPLKNLTTLGIGGPAKEFVEVKTKQELIETLKYAKENNLNFLIIGGGSNLLVSDDGFPGLVIKNKIKGIKINNNLVKVSSGETLQDLVDYTTQNGLSGISRLTGIPGSVGGAVFGNAGAYGQTISDFIESVVCLDNNFEEKVLSKNDCNFSYRDSGFKTNGLIILEVYFDFPKADPEKLKKESEETLSKRLLKYKPGIKCPGSFFKNILSENLSEDQKALIPPDRDTFGKIPAWFFLDEVSAKGAKKGNIEIADFHGNLFINTGEGTAADFYDLAKEYALKVKEKFGVELEPEVQLVNLPPLF